MKKLFSLFVAMMAAFSLSAKTIYCKMSQSWWTADGAAVGIYTWNNDGNKAAWPGERMTLVEGTTDVWSFDLDLETYDVCIFTRVNGEGDVADWGAKTGEQLIPTDENDLFTITSETAVWGDPGCDGVWSKYEPAAPAVDEWAEIAFSAPATADEIDADASFTVDGFTVAITDPDNKMAIDANTARFGTPEAFTDYTHRLKTGGKSSATKNFITLNIPAAGQLRIAVRTGSNSATDRNLVIAQGEDTLYNQVIKEDDKTVVPGEGGDTNYYPYVIVPVQAGSVVLTYPVNGLNFYGFSFQAAEIPELRLADGYYLIGLTMADWTVEYITADYLFVENAENPGEYKLDVTLAAEQQFKVVKVESDAIVTWYPDGMDNNYIVDAAHAGAKTVYFRPDGQGGQDWHYGMIFVPANEEGIEEVIAAGKAAKIVRDGQLLILKGNKTFNAQGAIVR